MAKPKSVEKVTKRLYAVLDKDFTYNYYSTTTLRKGQEFRVGRRYGYELYKEGLCFTLGHGASEMIPRSHFHLEEETELTVTTVARERKVL